MASQKNLRKTNATVDGATAHFDKFDLAILRELLVDSRRTLQEIGDAVNLSPTTCWSRIKRMQAEACTIPFLWRLKWRNFKAGKGSQRN